MPNAHRRWWEEEHDKLTPHNPGRKEPETSTSNVPTGSPKKTMTRFFKYRIDVARCVEKVLRHIEDHSTSIITIEQVKSGGYSVTIVTTELSDAIKTEPSLNGLDVT